MDGEANLARLWAAYNDTAASKGARSVAAQGKLEAVLNDIKTIIAKAADNDDPFANFTFWQEKMKEIKDGVANTAATVYLLSTNFLNGGGGGREARLLDCYYYSHRTIPPLQFTHCEAKLIILQKLLTSRVTHTF